MSDDEGPPRRSTSGRRRPRRRRRAEDGEEADDSRTERRRRRRSPREEEGADERKAEEGSAAHRRRARTRGRRPKSPRGTDRGLASLRGGGGGGGGSTGVAAGSGRTPLRSSLAKQFKRMRARRKRVAERQAELHVMGELRGGSGFLQAASCKWRLAAGKEWKLLGGAVSGHSQVDEPERDEMAVWAHPLDAHWSTNSVAGWPRLLLEVWGLDTFGRNEVLGYGFVHLPAAPGSFELEVNTWRPVGGMSDEISAFFLGSSSQLVSDDTVFTRAWEDRCRLLSVSSGTVHVAIDVLMRYFDDYSVEWGVGL